MRRSVAAAVVALSTALSITSVASSSSAAGGTTSPSRPASVQTDLVALVEGVLPILRAADAFRSEYPGRTFRDTLGLHSTVDARTADRYAATA